MMHYFNLIKIKLNRPYFLRPAQTMLLACLLAALPLSYSESTKPLSIFAQAPRGRASHSWAEVNICSYKNIYFSPFCLKMTIISLEKSLIRCIGHVERLEAA